MMEAEEVFETSVDLNHHELLPTLWDFVERKTLKAIKIKNLKLTYYLKGIKGGNIVEVLVNLYRRIHKFIFRKAD